MTSETKPETRGRPSLYTEELGNLICARIADGENVRKICEDEGMPAARTVFSWASNTEDFKEFATKYHEARGIQRDGMAEEIIQIADRKISFADPEVARAKLAQREQRIKSRQWILTKLDDRFRERTKVEHSGSIGTVKIEGGLPDEEVLPAALSVIPPKSE